MGFNISFQFHLKFYQMRKSYQRSFGVRKGLIGIGGSLNVFRKTRGSRESLPTSECLEGYERRIKFPSIVYAIHQQNIFAHLEVNATKNLCKPNKRFANLNSCSASYLYNVSKQQVALRYLSSFVSYSLVTDTSLLWDFLFLAIWKSFAEITFVSTEKIYGKLLRLRLMANDSKIMESLSIKYQRWWKLFF